MRLQLIFLLTLSSFVTRFTDSAPIATTSATSLLPEIPEEEEDESGRKKENDIDQSSVEKEDPQKATNSFIDDVIDMLRELYGRQMDPLRIPRQRTSFEKSLLGIKFYGSASLDEGRLNGLSRLHRHGDAILGPDSNSGLQFADVTLGIEDLNMTSVISLSFLGATVDSRFILQLSSLQVNIKSYLTHPSNKPILDDMVITRMDGMRIDVPGFGFAASRIIDMIASGILMVFKGSIKEVIRSNLLTFVDRTMNRPRMRM